MEHIFKREIGSFQKQKKRQLEFPSNIDRCNLWGTKCVLCKYTILIVYKSPIALRILIKYHSLILFYCLCFMGCKEKNVEILDTFFWSSSQGVEEQKMEVQFLLTVFCYYRLAIFYKPRTFKNKINTGVKCDYFLYCQLFFLKQPFWNLTYKLFFFNFLRYLTMRKKECFHFEEFYSVSPLHIGLLRYS